MPEWSGTVEFDLTRHKECLWIISGVFTRKSKHLVSDRQTDGSPDDSFFSARDSRHLHTNRHAHTEEDRHTHAPAHTRTHTKPCPDAIMSPWKNSCGVKLREGLFSLSGFDITRLWLKIISKKPPSLWSDAGRSEELQPAQKRSWLSCFAVYLCVSRTREGCSCQKGMEQEVTECESATVISVSSASTEEAGDFCSTCPKEAFRGFYLPRLRSVGVGGERNRWKTVWLYD